MDDDLFSKACDEWDSGNLTVAFNLFLTAAKCDQHSSMLNLAVFYDQGYGTEKDAKKAFYWYRKAASKGDSAACSNIANNYRKAGNIRKAKFWLKKALTLQDDGDAALELAQLYLMIKRKDNYTKALVYLAKAIDSKFISDDSYEEACSLKNKLLRIIEDGN